MTMLDVSSLTAGYGDIPVLRGIDLRIDAGQFVAVLGRNGAGKSTTMRCIAGLHTPDSGTITLNGGEVTRSEPTSVSAAGWHSSRRVDTSSRTSRFTTT